MQTRAPVCWAGRKEALVGTRQQTHGKFRTRCLYVPGEPAPPAPNPKWSMSFVTQFVVQFAEPGAVGACAAVACTNDSDVVLSHGLSA